MFSLVLKFSLIYSGGWGRNRSPPLPSFSLTAKSHKNPEGFRHRRISSLRLRRFHSHFYWILTPRFRPSPFCFQFPPGGTLCFPPFFPRLIEEVRGSPINYSRAPLENWQGIMSLAAMFHGVRYWLSEHPSIVNFSWNHSHSWGSTWSFLFAAIATYVASAVLLHLLLLPRRRPVPLGPIPAVYSLGMALASATIFAGILLSAEAEIRETRWAWRRWRTTPLRWLLCFPIGTRSMGRVFFWSYAFYLSRFLHLFRTFATILRRRRLNPFQLFNQSIFLCMSFLWLEFSQSFQVLAILSTSMVYALVYGYRFWVAIGMRGARFPFVVNCQIVSLSCHLACHCGVLLLHLFKGGCNGIGAWVFNSVLNGAVMLLFLMHLRKRAFVEGGGESSSRGEAVEFKEKRS